jgi:hypothetical protein
MKKANLILLFFIFIVICSSAYSLGVVDPPYEIGTWQGFRSAAITYTFDDGCSNQYSIAIPMFNEFGFKLTMYPVINWGPNWTALQNAALVGHEVGSHTMSHPNLSELTIEEQTTELVNSQNAVNSHIPGNQCVTIAYPYCAPSDTTLTRQYYISGRHCQGYIEPDKPANWYSVSSIICGSQGSVNSEAAFISKFTSTAGSGGWCVFLIHGIDGDGGYSPLSSATLRASLEYLDGNRDTFWVSTFANVTKYVKERRNTSVSESSSQPDSITLQVTDTLDDTLYNYPISIRRPLPDGWGSASVLQDGNSVPTSIVVDNSVTYVMFDVVPDGGDVVLSKGIYGDFTGNGIVDMNDLADFLYFWLINDCDQTAGADLDENCIVNLCEFSALAENWL